MTTEEIVDGTLAWCNKIRVTKNMEPLDKLPKGRISDGMTCPCGKATELFVGRTMYCEQYEHLEESGIDLPKVVREFVKLFDSHDLPEYVDDTTPNY